MSQTGFDGGLETTESSPGATFMARPKKYPTRSAGRPVDTQRASASAAPHRPHARAHRRRSGARSLRRRPLPPAHDSLGDGPLAQEPEDTTGARVSVTLPSPRAGDSGGRVLLGHVAILVLPGDVCVELLSQEHLLSIITAEPDNSGHH
jgi:hypothetical protein